MSEEITPAQFREVQLVITQRLLPVLPSLIAFLEALTDPEDLTESASASAIASDAQYFLDVILGKPTEAQPSKDSEFKREE